MAVAKEAIAEDLAEGYRDMDPRELRKLNRVCLLLHASTVWQSIMIK